MGALAQSIATSLGNAGAGYGEARDQQTAEKNDLSFKLAAQVRQRQQDAQNWLRNAQQDNLQRQVTEASLSAQKARQAGTWKPIGGALRNSTGGYSINEMNDTTGEIRTRPLPDGITPENKTLDKWNDLDDAHFKVTGQHLPKSMQDAFFAHEVAEPKPGASEVDLALEAFRRDHGREPTLAEYTKMVTDLHPKTGTGEGAGGLDAMAAGVSSGVIKLAKVSSKTLPDLLRYMRDNGYKLPNQLPAGTEVDLETRSVAMQRALELIDDIQPRLKYMQSIPGATLTYLAENPGKTESLISRIWGDTLNTKEQTERDQLVGDLQAFNEAINIIRKPLGATVFRGKEGFAQLMGNTAQPLKRPGVNAEVLKQTRETIQALYDKTASLLGGTDLEGQQQSGGSGDTGITVSAGDIAAARQARAKKGAAQ